MKAQELYTKAAAKAGVEFIGLTKKNLGSIDGVFRDAKGREFTAGRGRNITDTADWIKRSMGAMQ